MKYIILSTLALVAVLIIGCTDEQVYRTQQGVKAAGTEVQRAEAALKTAEAALDAMRKIAAQLDVEKADIYLEKAEGAVAVARDVKKIADIALVAATDAAAAAKKAHDEGGGTLSVLLGAATALLPSAAALFAAVRSSIQKGRSFTQTVRGLDVAREQMGDELWDKHVAPALEAAQDTSVKDAVRLLQR